MLTPLDIAHKLHECINKRKQCIEDLISMYEHEKPILDPDTISKREELATLRIREDELTRVLQDMLMLEWKCKTL